MSRSKATHPAHIKQKKFETNNMEQPASMDALAPNSTENEKTNETPDTIPEITKPPPHHWF